MIDAMQVLQHDNVRVTLDREGARTYTKASYPIRYGRYAEIDYEGYVFQYNLNGEIKHIGSTGPDWPHPAEWLKRTIGNDWVYYSTGSYYTGTADLFGEFYMVCPAYQTNSLFKEDPFSQPGVATTFGKLRQRHYSNIPRSQPNGFIYITSSARYRLLFPHRFGLILHQLHFHIKQVAQIQTYDVGS